MENPLDIHLTIYRNERELAVKVRLHRARQQLRTIITSLDAEITNLM